MSHIAVFISGIEILPGGVLGVSGTAKVSSEEPNDPGVVWTIEADWTWTDIELDGACINAAIVAAQAAGKVINDDDTKRIFAGCK